MLYEVSRSASASSIARGGAESKSPEHRVSTRCARSTGAAATGTSRIDPRRKDPLMCSPVRCSDCGKTTWAGCGLHIDEALAGVAAEQRCACPR
jgi:hypothetical protein